MIAALATASRRVLVVDDNHDVADMEAALLRLCGHEVMQAYDGRQALQLVGEFRPEVVFLDIMMPGIDGREVARQLREMEGGDEIRIVALTALPHRIAGHGAGFDSYIPKPATAADFFRELGTGPDSASD